MASMVSHSPAHHPSPGHSPSLRPIGPAPGSLPNLAPLANYSPRSYARAPTQRPYLLSNNRSAQASRITKPVIGDTKTFADKVAFLVEQRSRQVRVSKPLQVGISPSQRPGRSLGGAGSFSSTSELERAELIIDYPVWSPGSFQDLSTLQALRETTLAYTHALINYLSVTHNIPASYRLLTRSAAATTCHANAPHSIGWGCIRLTPSVTSPVQHRAELRPAVRRTSTVGSPPGLRHSRRASSSHSKSSASSPLDDIPQFRLDFEEAIADEDEEDEVKVELKEGFTNSASGSDDEDDEECADVIIAREVERRNMKEGAFIMELFGAPALILC